MIYITSEPIETYDSESNTFKYSDVQTVRFEYSLKAIYNWEGKWQKPFLKGEHTGEQWIDFYLDMALDPVDVTFFTEKILLELARYITSTNTATKFNTYGQEAAGQTIKKGKFETSEEIYSMMITAGIPIEFEERNFNRLMVILKIHSNAHNPPKKMSKEDVMKQNANLNEQRKKQMQSKG